MVGRVGRSPARGRAGPAAWGSDVIAGTLQELGIRYLMITPGASLRGLHDSVVNYLGDEAPQLVLCLHEEHAVALAHGYAKVAGEPAGVALHSNVGLMHAAMAIYNAYCDRVPIVLIGATGPVDAAKRRPWIDWIHTSADQAMLVRPYVKWDDQPASVAAAVSALLRANQIARTAPQGPVYVCLDAGIQEQPCAGASEIPADFRRFGPFPDPWPGSAEVARAAELLQSARRVVMLAGRVSRDEQAWRERVELAERLRARVLTDLKVGAAFPTSHRQHGGPPGNILCAGDRVLLRAADLVLSLDWADLGGTLSDVFRDQPVPPVISCSLEHHRYRGWTKDDYIIAPSDVVLACHPDQAVRSLLGVLAKTAAGPGAGLPPAVPEDLPPAVRRGGSDGAISISFLAQELRAIIGERACCLIRVPFGWDPQYWPFTSPFDYLGQDGGGGVGSGPGMAVGAALALRGKQRLAVAVLGDGDFIMGATALWTAAHCQLPLLVVVANNCSFFNDELHQDAVAARRARSRSNRSAGTSINDPAPDLAMLARSQGVSGFGPVADPAELAPVLRQALGVLDNGLPAVADVRVERRYEGRENHR